MSNKLCRAMTTLMSLLWSSGFAAAGYVKTMLTEQVRDLLESQQRWSDASEGSAR
jgi:hypothetical protein